MGKMLFGPEGNFRGSDHWAKLEARLSTLCIQVLNDTFMLCTMHRHESGIDLPLQLVGKKHNEKISQNVELCL